MKLFLYAIIAGLWLRSKRLFCAPASSDSVEQCVRLYPDTISPERDGHCFPIKSQTSVCGCVVALLFAGSPSAILFGIPKGAINPVNRHSSRSLPHITKKPDETIPLRANGNSFQRIKMRLLGCVGFAPVTHSSPYRICSATRHPVCLCFVRAKPVIPRLATATLCAPRSDRRANGDQLRPAVAYAIPSGVLSSAGNSRFAYHTEFAKPKPGHVFDGHVVYPFKLIMYAIFYMAKPLRAIGVHGNRAMLNMTKKTELALAAETLEALYG